MNDEINKLIKEKGSYELRIKELGGPDYKASVERMYDDEGDILPGKIISFKKKEYQLKTIKELFSFN